MSKIVSCENVEIINMIYLKGEYVTPLIAAIGEFSKANQNVRDFYIYFEKDANGVLDISFLREPNSEENVSKKSGVNKAVHCPNVEAINKVYLKGKYVIPLVSAITAFNETNQNIVNFCIYLDYLNERKDDIIDITFSPKRAPGERILGGRTSYGQAIRYLIDMQTGKVIKTLGVR